MRSQRRAVVARSSARLGLLMLGLLLLAALFADWLAPYPAMQVALENQLAAPSAEHWLGCDENGRDVLSLLLYGSRVSLLVGVCSMLISLLIGASLGAFAGFVGRWLDELVMRVIDVFFAFPGILLAILMVFLLRDAGVGSVILALSVSGWASYARLTRGEVLREREMEYVNAARLLGLSRLRIVFRHVMPNVMGPLLVQATFGVATAILAESTLSFLGLGPGLSPFWGMSWGALLDQGSQYFLLTPHLALAPGLLIMMTVLAINFVGDALRDDFDPFTAQER
ncbi:MAG: ABC transporter permease [Myxococcota bacterium]|nr:ABC transporter permease [Myxococcota bacterium]